MPLCSKFENESYYFNTKPEILTKEIQEVFSSMKYKSNYILVCHVLDSKEVFFTIVKPEKSTNRFISSYTTLKSLYGRCIRDRLKISKVGFTRNYSIKSIEVSYYE